MGNDQSIEQAARGSYGLGTRKVSETRGLIRYLYRHEHTTPSEMVEFKFHAKMPIFVARQWVRHRTASINEQSARYSILDKEFYIPEPEVIAAQSTTNRQGRGEVLDPAQAEFVRRLLIDDASRNYEHYEYMLNDDGKGKPVDPNRDMVARELSRVDLTLNFYTQWYWKTDLHNLFHFLHLRADPHAQYEIRVYAEAMSKILKDAVPIAWEAFEDYKLYAISLSKPDQQVFAEILKKNNITLSVNELLDIINGAGIKDKYERAEMLEKFDKLGVIKK
jgi:thymidylate synthase (FAD)